MSAESITFRSHHRSPPTADSAGMDDLQSFYSCVNKEEIEDFLARKPHMVEVLRELAEFLGGKYGVAKTRIEHFADDSYGYDALDVIPAFRTKDKKELKSIKKEVFYNFFCRMNLPFSESLVLTVRACDHD